MRTSYCYFTIRHLGVSIKSFSDLAEPVFHGHLPVCLLCPSEAHSEFLYTRFLEVGDVQVHFNLDSTPGAFSVAAFLEVSLAKPMQLLPTDYLILDDIAGGHIPRVDAELAHAMFGNGLDLTTAMHDQLELLLRTEGMLTLTVGYAHTPGLYLFPKNVQLFKGKTCSREPYNVFMQRIFRTIR